MSNNLLFATQEMWIEMNKQEQTPESFLLRDMIWPFWSTKGDVAWYIETQKELIE